MRKIANVKAREILDSRGNPTIEADIILESGDIGRASVPSGASVGQFEALEKRDKDSNRYQGKSVKEVIESALKFLKEALIGLDVTQQSLVDKRLIERDGTENKNHLGANALLAFSLATARAASAYYKMPLYRYLGGIQGVKLPLPMMNILNGGTHADNSLSIQEFMIIPTSAPSFSEAIHMGACVFHSLKSSLKTKGHTINVGDEGGFAPDINDSDEAFDFILQAIEKAGFKIGKDICLAIDVAASELWTGNDYLFQGKKKTAEELINHYERWVEVYPLISIEDGLREEDWINWALLTKRLGKKTQLVGDDLFVTNQKRLKRGIEENSANAILIKPNQIGTLTETLEVITQAKRAGFNIIVSHRSGETEDTFIADLSLAINANYIKAGSLSRTDRVSKYNQLIRIEEIL